MKHIPNIEKMHESSNTHYKIESVDVLEDKEEIIKIIRHFEAYQLPRLQLLETYYANNNYTIHRGQRRKNEDKADHRASHGFANAITSFHVNYLTGVPIRIEPLEEDDSVGEYISEFNARNDIDAHHSDLATDLSKYGRAYELIHYGDETNVYLSNPYWTIVIYDESIEMRPIAALRFPKVERGTGAKYVITLYTNDRIIEFEPCNLIAEELVEKDVTEHKFGEVPIIEYSHNRHRYGDYEKVLTQIDLYDAAQSDTANYMTDTNDAVLVISGDFESSNIEYSKEIDAILLESGKDIQGRQTSVDAKYIYKQYDVAGTEAYKKRIEKDIYKFSKTPNLTAESFTGHQSGESKRYMMIDPEQERSNNERILTKGFNRRYRMILNNANFVRDFTQEFDGLKYVFTPNMPESIKDDLQTFVSAGGRVSNRTLLAQLPFVEDVDKELENIEVEDYNWVPSDSERV